ncbi:MAG: class I SAM-dependent methyltransferase [Magnetovibrio sp.]|nr:class I SAM-dependent methyltransferase [Magnetovibrio sp.]
MEFPFDDGEFDVVLSASLVNLVPDRVALFASMARVLRPGCVASVLFPSPDFTLDQVERLASSLTVMSGAALRLWASVRPNCNPDAVMRDAEMAGLVGAVCATTWIDGLVSVTTQAP